jgi:hypothetical protein
MLPEEGVSLPADTITPHGATMAATPGQPPPAYQAVDPFAPPTAHGSQYLTPDAFGPTDHAYEASKMLAKQDAPAQAAPQAPSPPPAQPQGPAPDVQFRGLGGGVSPAHEAATRGPVQNQHLMASFDAPMEAAGRMEDRSRWLAEEERNAFELEAGKAMERQATAEKVALQRQAEMERRAIDFEEQVQNLGQMHVDSNRWWASKSTGDKIGTAVLAFLGGLGALDPKGNGRNIVWEHIVKEMDEDVEAQKFDAMVQMKQVEGAQNAYAMALDRYRNEDAAHAAARAAAIDFTMAKVNQLQAQWKGAEAANAADDLRARLAMERERTIAAGLKFIPAQAAPGRYEMVIHGQRAPGTFSEKDAQAAWLKHHADRVERVEGQELGIAGQMVVKGVELRGKGDEKGVEGAKDIAHQMQSAGVPKMRALTQAALAAMADDEGGKGEAATRSLVRGLVPFVGEGAANAIMSDKANAREQAFQAFANLNMNQLSGGAISPSEEGRLKAQLGSTSDPAARRRALMSVMTQLDAAEANIKAPYVGTGAAEQYDRGAKRTTAPQAKSLTFHGGK